MKCVSLLLAVMPITPKGITSILARPCTVVLVICKDMWCWFIFSVPVRQEIARVLYHEIGQFLDNSPTVYNKCDDGTICWLGHPVLRWLPEVWPSVLFLGSHPLFRDIMAKGWKAATFHQAPLHMMVNSVICIVLQFSLLFTQLIPGGFLGSQGSGGGVTSSSTMASGKRQERPPLLKVEYMKGPRFGSLLS